MGYMSPIRRVLLINTTSTNQEDTTSFDSVIAKPSSFAMCFNDATDMFDPTPNDNAFADEKPYWRRLHLHKNARDANAPAMRVKSQRGARLASQHAPLAKPVHVHQLDGGLPSNENLAILVRCGNMMCVL